MFDEIFAQKKPCPDRLITYGFELRDGVYRYTCSLMDGDFQLHITVDPLGGVDTSLTESDTDEAYTLYKTTAQGIYLGQVREAIAAVLQDMADHCFTSSRFRQEQTIQLLAHAAAVYGDQPEFLWETTPQNGILRRADSGKWYAAILTIPKNKLGLDSQQVVEIVNFHATPADVEQLLKRPGIYPGWHMNKKSWYTIILDGSIANEDLFRLMADSYRLAGKS